MIQFVVKRNTDLHRYGFIFDGVHEWFVRRGTKRIYLDDRNNILHFNMITLEVLAIFYHMICDGRVFFQDTNEEKSVLHFVALSDEEYDIILKKRIGVIKNESKSNS